MMTSCFQVLDLALSTWTHRITRSRNYQAAPSSIIEKQILDKDQANFTFVCLFTSI